MSIAISNAVAALRERLDNLSVAESKEIPILQEKIGVLFEKVIKLEGEIRAMKARMGRNPPAVQSVKEEAA